MAVHRFARRSRGRITVLVLVVAVAGVAACVPTVPTPTTPDYGLRTTLTPTGFVVSWNAPVDAPPDAIYDVQSKAGAGAWVDEPDAATTSADVVGVPKTKHSFRVRLDSTTAWSEEASATFVIPVLPVLRIDTTGRAPIVDKETYLSGTIKLDPNGSPLPEYEGSTQIKGRGNSTWNHPKKPYRLKLASSTALGGMPKSKHWVLLANYLDASQLRNATAFDLSSQTSLVWTPRYQFVEVVLNGSYDGVYMLVEQVRGASDRVPITEMDSSDIEGEALTGGYLLEVDQYLEQNSEPGWRTTQNVPVVVKEPDPATPEQMEYARSSIQAFEDALFAPDFTNPDSGYRGFVDIASMVDYYLLNEVTGNVDGFFSSAYLWKERSDPLLHFGPAWDFDASMGNALATISPYWFWTRVSGPWLPRAFQDPWFNQQVVDRWNELRPAFQSVADQILARADSLAPAVANDNARWARGVGDADQPAYVSHWLNERIGWLSTQYPG